MGRLRPFGFGLRRAVALGGLQQSLGGEKCRAKGGGVTQQLAASQTGRRLGCGFSIGANGRFVRHGDGLVLIVQERAIPRCNAQLCARVRWDSSGAAQEAVLLKYSCEPAMAAMTWSSGVPA